MECFLVYMALRELARILLVVVVELGGERSGWWRGRSSARAVLTFMVGRSFYRCQESPH